MRYALIGRTSDWAGEGGGNSKTIQPTSMAHGDDGSD